MPIRKFFSSDENNFCLDIFNQKWEVYTWGLYMADGMEYISQVEVKTLLQL